MTRSKTPDYIRWAAMAALLLAAASDAFGQTQKMYLMEMEYGIVVLGDIHSKAATGEVMSELGEPHLAHALRKRPCQCEVWVRGIRAFTGRREIVNQWYGVRELVE